MQRKIFSLLLLLGIASCTQEKCEECAACGENLNVKTESLEEAVMTVNSEPKKDTTELAENIEKIEKKYGEQWDFCNCVIVGDSINDALQKDLSDKALDVLLKRFDYVDKKCQAFRIQDPNRTPEEREAHERKVRKCLRNAGKL